MIRCPVRGCGERLALAERAAACPRGHSFDRAKSGYWNLLQPQDRRSLAAGDNKEVVAARRRLFEGGFFAPLTEGLVEIALDSDPGGENTLLDIGCGEGSHLAALCSRFPHATGVGVDLSTPAIDLAARSHPKLTWIVANADRGLPLLDHSIDLAVSITGRRPMDELARVLRPGGRLVIVVPAPDDLVELRTAILGDDDARDRFATVLAELESVPGAFEILDRRIVRHRTILGPEALRDLTATTYRRGRKAREERLSALPAGGMEVTGAWELVSARRR